MDPTLEEKQNDQPQEKQRQGIISRGINSFNNLRGANRLLSNPLGRIGTRVVLQAGLRGFAAFLAGPGLPIAIAIASVFIFTLIIVLGFGGAPSSETNVQAPQASPALTPIAFPAEP